MLHFRDRRGTVSLRYRNRNQINVLAVMWKQKPMQHGFRARTRAFRYSWFSHDITKIQTKKLSLLLSFFFHVILQHLKTFIQTNFRFKTVLRFATLDAWISRLLRDAAFSWRPGKLLCGLKTLPILGDFCYLNIPCLRINITLILMSSSSKEFTH